MSNNELPHSPSISIEQIEAAAVKSAMAAAKDSRDNYRHADMLVHFAGQALAGDWAAQSDTMGQWEHNTSAELLQSRARLYWNMALAMVDTMPEEAK